MDSATVLKTARERAGLSQRQLAERCGVHQPAIARIESGKVRPGIETLNKLLNGCGQELFVRPVMDDGVDRTMIRERLKWSVEQRLSELAHAAVELDKLREAVVRATR